MRLPILAGLAFLLSIVGAARAQSPSVCPDDFQAYAGTSEPLACTCEAEAVERGYVGGMDVYTVNSSICRAALHAGAIGPKGGTVKVIPEAGRNAYPGVTRNGVTSQNDRKAEASFRFEVAGQGTAGAATAKTSAAPTTASVCPDDFQAYAGTSEPLACTCDAEAVERGYVGGMDVYTVNSSICRAALHAGAIGPEGGTVTVIPEAGRNAYPGVTRNGVTSQNERKAEASFRFEVAAVEP